MAILFNTKTWKMTPEDARELAQSLIYAADKSEYTDEPWSLEIDGIDFNIKKFKIIIFKEKEAQEPTFLPAEVLKESQTVSIEKE